MRIWQVTIGTALVGVLVGVGHALIGYRDPGLELRGFLADPLPAQNVIPVEDAAVLVVENGESYDFGSMDRGETLEHAFVFRNNGTRPLKLGTPRTDCMCMLPELGSEGIPPGESRDVILRWTPRKYEMEFRQTATIPTTGDPRRRVVTLEVFGRVLPRIRSVPATVSVGNITSLDERELQTIIYGYQSDTLEVTGTNWLQPQLADRFEVSFRPATPEELEREIDAKSALVCQLKIKPGLPLGGFHQRLTVDLQTDKKNLSRDSNHRHDRRRYRDCWSRLRRGPTVARSWACRPGSRQENFAAVDGQRPSSRSRQADHQAHRTSGIVDRAF